MNPYQGVSGRDCCRDSPLLLIEQANITILDI